MEQMDSCLIGIFCFVLKKRPLSDIDKDPLFDVDKDLLSNDPNKPGYLSTFVQKLQTKIYEETLKQTFVIKTPKIKYMDP